MYEWVVAETLVVTSLAAAAALYFTSQSIKATNNQLRISEQGQITERYNAAIANLGSRSIDILLGGIYALQRLMEDSPRDQPTVIAVLCAFVRDRAMSTRKSQKTLAFPPPTDIQAVLTVVGTRNPANDGPAIVIDLNRTQLAVGQLEHGNFTRADLTRANLTRAILTGAKFSGAYLNDADLSKADLTGASLDYAHLTRADLTHANLTHAELTRANLDGALWPADTAVPEGWVRDTHSGRLKRPGT